MWIWILSIQSQNVKSAVGKICFSRGVALPYAPDSLAGGGVFLVMANLESYKSGVMFWYRSMKSWLGGGGTPNSTHKNTPYRLDKLHSALAEAQLKTDYPLPLEAQLQHNTEIGHDISWDDLERLRNLKY